VVTVTKGTTQQFTAAVEVSGGAAQTVEWSIVDTHATGTTLVQNDQGALLTIAGNESATSLTVKAVSTADSSKFDTAEVTVTAQSLPTVGTAVINTAGTQLTLTFNEAVTVTGSAPYGFTLNGTSGAINIADKSGSGASWTFTLSRPAVQNETITLSYSGNAVKNGANNSLAAFSGRSITNNVGSSELPALSAPVLSNEGVVTWTAVTPETNVAKYSVQLYKGESSVTAEEDVSKGSTYSKNYLADMRTGGTGEYTAKVKVFGNTGYADSAPVSSNSQTVYQQPPVEHLWWGGNIARWKNVGAAGDYKVQLYKGGVISGAEISVTRGTLPDANEGTDTEYDFSTAITTGGTGNYTFKVTLSGDGKLALDSPASDASPGNIFEKRIAAVTGLTLNDAGVAAWTASTDNTYVGSYSVKLYRDGSNLEDTQSVTAPPYQNNFLTKMREAVGSYTVKVTAISSGGGFEDSIEVTSGAQTVTQRTKVSAVWWGTDNSLTAHWTDVDGLDGVSDYSAALYKDNSSDPVITVTESTYYIDGENNWKSYADFTNAIETAGPGAYTFTVTTKGNATLILDAEPSGFSDQKLVGVEELPTLSAPNLSNQGVVTWNAVDPETNVAGYSVQLFKGESSVTEEEDVSKGPSYSKNYLADMRNGGIGEYTVKVKVFGNTGYADSSPVSSNSQAVYQQPTVEHLWWEGTEARWVNVDSTSDYSLQLYKDGIASGSAVSVSRQNTPNPEGAAGETITAFNLADSILNPGVYTFKVTTKGNAMLILDAEPSNPSGEKTIGIFTGAKITLTLSDEGTSLSLSGAPQTPIIVDKDHPFTLTVTTTGTTTYDYAWFVDDSSVGITGNSITIKAEDYERGGHKVLLQATNTVTKKPWSPEKPIAFSVEK
jgi:hypothetical protein